MKTAPITHYRLPITLPILLHIETATKNCSVAISKNNRMLALLEQSDKQYIHSESLTAFIEQVMKQVDYSVSALDAVAVSCGPGSYTGLRIGVSTAKGICYALSRPLIAVNTLHSFAVSAASICLPTTDHRLPIADYQPSGTLYCPMIDARRMEVYYGLYDEAGGIIKPACAEVIAPDTFSKLLSERTVIFFGDGAPKCKSILEGNRNAVFADMLYPSATGMIRLAEQAFNEKHFEDVAYFEPYYLKDFVGTIPHKKLG